MILALLISWISVTIIWLISSSYARKETVVGWLEPSSGVVRVYAEQSGIIKQVLVREGEQVVKGQPLFVVNGDRVLADGKNLESLLMEEYESQQELLTEQLKRGDRIYQQQLRNIKQQIAASKGDLALLEQQIVTQGRRYSLVKRQLEGYRQLQRDGHISSAELDTMMAQGLELQAERQSLERGQINLRNQIQQLESQRSILPEEFANTRDQLRGRLSDLAQQISQLHGQRAYIIKAPRSGTVSNLQAREGLKAQSGFPMLSLVPGHHALVAQLLVPVRAAGLVETGQALNIRYDAFPYQKFGLFDGAVAEVSETVLLPNELLHAPVTLREPAYKVTATLATPTVKAYGKNFSLKPGMTLSADVQLGERSLLQWLLEPLYSLKGRI